MTPSDIDATAAPAAGNPHREDKDKGRDRDKGAAAVDSANTAAPKVQCAWAECTAEFGSMHMLAAHLSNTHIASEQGSDNTCHWHACPHNSTPFSSRYDLVTHLKRHTGNRSFLCPYDGCGKVYKRVDFLSKHINTHSAANNNAGNARAQLSIPGRQVRRARQKAAAAEYHAVDVISDTDSSSSEDAPLALISASKKRKKTNPCSSDNDNDNDATARASSNPYRYRTGSNSGYAYNCNDDDDNSNDEDISPNPQLVSLLESRLTYIRQEVAMRKEKLLHIKSKTRRMRLENDILIDALAEM